MTSKKERNPGGYGELWKVAYPLIITNATHTVMQFMDRKFLAMNATNDVAAALPGGILAFTMFTFFMVTTGFTAAIVAQNHGRNNHKMCARVPWSGFYFALFAGVISSFLLLYPGIAVINFSGHTGLLATAEMSYFRMILPSGAFIFITTAFSSFFSGRGKTWVVAVISCIASVVNIILDYIFIFGHFGVPKMGIAGAGAATTTACAVGAVIAFLFFIFQDQKKYPTRTQWHFHRDDMRRLISFGAPAGYQVFFSVGAFTMIVFLIGKLGTTQLAATTIALSINMITFMPLLGISEATGILTGKYAGALKHDIAERAAYRAWRISTGYMVFMGMVYLSFPELLLNFFAPAAGDRSSDFAEVIYIGRVILMCAAFYNIFNVLRFVFMGALRGAGDTKIPMWIIIISSWFILAPGGYIFINILKLDIVAVWIFLTVYSGLVGGVIFWRFRSNAWKKINMLEKSSDIPMGPKLLEALEFENDKPHI